MRYECPVCQRNHLEVPSACESCGTPPDIRSNQWVCSVCQHQNPDSLREYCQGCGAEPDRNLKISVSDKPVPTELGVALANAGQQICPFCQGFYTSHHPLTGLARTTCPLCGAAVSASTEQAGIQTLQAGEAPQPVSFVPVGTGDPDLSNPDLRDPDPSDLSRSEPKDPFQINSVWNNWAIRAGLVGVFLLIGLGVWALSPQKLEGTVAGKTWTVEVQIEQHQFQTRQGWSDDRPSWVVSERCDPTPRWRRNREVFDHTETYFVTRQGGCVAYRTDTAYTERQGSCRSYRTESYQVQVPNGKTCTSSSYKSNGKVSVKQCSSWATQYGTQTRTRQVCTGYDQIREPHQTRVCTGYDQIRESRTRPVYRTEPIYGTTCSWIIDAGWVPIRVESRTGSGSEPVWSPQGSLDQETRYGSRTVGYQIEISTRKAQNIRARIDSLRWSRIPLGSPIRVRISRFSGDVIDILDGN